MSVKFELLAVSSQPAATLISDPALTSAELNFDAEITNFPPLTAQNVKLMLSTTDVGANSQFATLRVHPVQLNSDVCDTPSELPTTNFSWLNNDVELVAMRPACRVPAFVPTSSCVGDVLPVTVSELLPLTISSSAKPKGPLTDTFRLLLGGRTLHRYPSVRHGQSENPHDGLSQLPAFTY
jgi:hypothetical protein